MISASIQMFVAAVLSAIGTYGSYLPGDTKGTILFFHFTEDRWIAVAELDASKTTVRSDTRLFAAPELSNLVRVARGADGIYIVVGRHVGDGDPVTLARYADGKIVTPPIEIGHGSDADVAARPDSKWVVTTFFETRPPNEAMHGRDLAPPTHVVHAQSRDSKTLALAGARMFRDRADLLLDDCVIGAPGIVLDTAKMTMASRVTLELQGRAHRRTVVAQLPLFEIRDDRVGRLTEEEDPSVTFIQPPDEN